MMKRCFLVVLSFVFISAIQHVRAEDCVVSTNPPRILDNYPRIVEQKLNEKKGFYLASLENGDQILVFFSPCELVLRAHYLMVQQNESEALKIIELFISRLIPVEKDISKINKQLSEKITLDSNVSVLLQGTNDQHKVAVLAAKNPFFSKEIHYEWVPLPH